MKLYRILPGLIDSQKNKITDEFTHSGLSAVRQAHRPELIEGLSESRLCREKAFVLIVYCTVFANRSTEVNFCTILYHHKCW